MYCWSVIHDFIVFFSFFVGVFLILRTFQIFLRQCQFFINKEVLIRWFKFVIDQFQVMLFISATYFPTDLTFPNVRGTLSNKVSQIPYQYLSNIVIKILILRIFSIKCTTNCLGCFLCTYPIQKHKAKATKAKINQTIVPAPKLLYFLQQ